ncbi:hypothetical protein TRFO_42731 [Tritrichomonas foetus]|uniref:Uncharacterized protein n=1 Tax=Tritrichomonas foetus TaxID=1144522 RepID=A0A1J4KZB6_9EUKA|nr:hypothetical protein TRFO_42731 [Tritrichomonas foetus]|eukprot:OHT15054.1 hypothetical protein TRFO_42731 [Tritrichomonas foetus]
MEENQRNMQNINGKEINMILSRNWPKQFPLFYFDLNIIPQHLQKYVIETFFSWIFMVATYLLNWIICFFCQRGYSLEESYDFVFLVSSFHLFIMMPLFLFFFHFEIYKIFLFELDSKSYTRIRVVVFIMLAFDTMSFMGSTNAGTCGTLNIISLLNDHLFLTAFFALIVYFMLMIIFFLHFRFLLRMYCLFNKYDVPFTMIDSLSEKVMIKILEKTQ